MVVQHKFVDPFVFGLERTRPLDVSKHLNLAALSLNFRYFDLIYSTSASAAKGSIKDGPG
jgi:hypothetical protein